MVQEERTMSDDNWDYVPDFPWVLAAIVVVAVITILFIVFDS